jgi:hypothetical protein
MIKIYSIFILSIFAIVRVYGQDVIVKNDKTEIQCKVVEIAEQTIKYKKWTMQDGPLYNVAKDDVFMIIYSNGTREKFDQAIKPANSMVPSNQGAPAVERPKQIVSSNNNIKSEKAENNLEKYPAILRLGVNGDAFDLALERTYGKKGNLGWGASFFASWDFVTYGGSLYVLCKFPIDVYGNNFKRGSGLFLWANAGIGYGQTTVTTVDIYGVSHTTSPSSDFFSYKIGCDIRFKAKIGLALYTESVNSIWFGFTYHY